MTVTLSVSWPLFEEKVWVYNPLVRLEEDPSWGRWAVFLYKSDGSLHIEVEPEGNHFDPGNFKYKSMHVFSHREDKFLVSKEISNIVRLARRCLPICRYTVEDANQVTFGDRYVFEIVITTPLRYGQLPMQHPTLNLVRELMPYNGRRRLMRDIYSVDVCFVFPSDTAYANIGLWAHRSILSLHKSFADIIAKQERNLGLTNARPASSFALNNTATFNAPVGYVVIESPAAPLATMCSLLSWIYKVGFAFWDDMSAFAISVDNGTSLVWHGNNPSRGINVHKNVFASPDPSSSWTLVLDKPTMHDILTAAEHFEVMDFVVRFYPLVYGISHPSSGHQT